jgi:hypothetical protein
MKYEQNARGSLKIDDYGWFFNVGMVGAKLRISQPSNFDPTSLVYASTTQQPTHTFGR